MPLLEPEEKMTMERAERVALAEKVAARKENPLDRCHRRGGYFLSSAGIPQDAEGRTIPEAEWKDDDFARIKGMTRAEAAAAAAAPASLPDVAPVRADGADVVEQSGSEKRTQKPGPRRSV